MIIARWRIDAKFGHKNDVIKSLKSWNDKYGAKLGWTPENTRMMTGSVGAAESTIITEVRLDDLSQLDRAWEKLAGMEGHAEWSRKLEPHVVSGTNQWEVYRVIE